MFVILYIFRVEIHSRSLSRRFSSILSLSHTFNLSYGWLTVDDGGTRVRTRCSFQRK